jgi:hypothetical protein
VMVAWVLLIAGLVRAIGADQPPTPAPQTPAASAAQTPRTGAGRRLRPLRPLRSPHQRRQLRHAALQRHGSGHLPICHAEPNVTNIFRAKHARPNDPRGPFGHGGLQCEACHGLAARMWMAAASRSRAWWISARKRKPPRPNRTRSVALPSIQYRP